jgi:nucleoside diphosphate kinase
MSTDKPMTEAPHATPEWEGQRAIEVRRVLLVVIDAQAAELSALKERWAQLKAWAMLHNQEGLVLEMTRLERTK